MKGNLKAVLVDRPSLNRKGFPFRSHGLSVPEPLSPLIADGCLLSYARTERKPGSIALDELSSPQNDQMDHVQNRLGSCLGSGLEDPLHLWAAALKSKQRAFSSPRHLSESHPHQILILSPLLFSVISFALYTLFFLSVLFAFIASTCDSLCNVLLSDSQL